MELFNMTTTLAPDKQLRNVQGTLALNTTPVTGYEIHAGVATYHSFYEPAIHFASGSDGAMSTDGLILGTYLHGLFESQDACAVLLAWAGLKDVQPHDYHALREAAIDRLADTVEQHLDIAQLNRLLHLT
jgi:adenosylcobyric acid synthase